MALKKGKTPTKNPDAVIPSPTLFEELRRFDTPTICNALLGLLPEKSKLTGFSRQEFQVSSPLQKPIVGLAKTGKIRASVGIDGDEESRREVEFYEYVNTGAYPKIIVIEDEDSPAGIGAFWGEVHTHLFQRLGALGAVTNGSMRDLDAMAPGFQVLAGQIGPSRAGVHLRAQDCPVKLHGMTIRPGDLIHADRHGAVVIPASVADRVVEAAELVLRRERVLLELLRSPEYTFEKLKAAIEKAGHVH